MRRGIGYLIGIEALSDSLDVLQLGERGSRAYSDANGARFWSLGRAYRKEMGLI